VKTLGDPLGDPGGVFRNPTSLRGLVPERGAVMRHLLLVSLLVLAVPAAGLAGENPNARLCMHLVASDAYLYSADLSALLVDDINQDVSTADLVASSYYVYVVFCAYNIAGISGLEFALDGFPSGRGAPPAPTIIWEPDENAPEEALVLGDILSGGAIATWGSGAGGCQPVGTRVRERAWWGDDNNTPGTCNIYPFAYFSYGFASYTSYLPITLSFIGSTYSQVQERIYTLDCTTSFVEDDVLVADTFGCIIGSDWGGDIVTAVDETSWSTIKSLYRSK
jgi:hypothetical protein